VPELTVASYNSHAGLEPRRHGVARPYDLPEVLRSFDADVTVVQESWTPDAGVSAARLVAEECGAQCFEIAFGRGRIRPWPHVPRERRTFGSLGLSVITRIPAEERGRLLVGRVPYDPTPERGALHLALDLCGTTVDFVGVHLTSRLPYGPPMQLRRLDAQLPPTGRLGVLAGDFNFWGPGVLAFLRGWRRAVRGRTWPARRPHSQIDHILVRPGVTVVAAEVLPEVGSDHRPVRATLRVEPKSA
jgi:endonuclease/exonuclease/phosphatase family metal-dependent hydrolase